MSEFPEEDQSITYQGHSHGTKDIWRSFWILLGITILDFILYFTMTDESIITLRNIIFIVFGVVKAYFVVFSFMHMKHERTSLVLTILVPVLFIIGLIMGLLYEGDYWNSIK